MLWAMFSGGCGIFQQDNAPCHKATVVQEWFGVFAYEQSLQVLQYLETYQ